MKAMVFDRRDARLRLGEIALRVAGPGEILVPARSS